VALRTVDVVAAPRPGAAALRRMVTGSALVWSMFLSLPISKVTVRL